MNDSIQSRPGTYALILRASRRRCIQIGRLGGMRLQPGTYIYVGSAFGPGGVAARVRRHQRGSHVRHWHIDYLWSVTRLVSVWFTHDPVRREHDWAGLFLDWPDVVIPLPGFGASDCRCGAHLFFFRTTLEFAVFRERAQVGSHRLFCYDCLEAGTQ